MLNYRSYPKIKLGIRFFGTLCTVKVQPTVTKTEHQPKVESYAQYIIY